MSLEKMLFEIDALKKEVSNMPKPSQAIMDKHMEHFITSYTYNSNAIEGSTLTLRDTHRVLVEGITINKKPLRDHLDAINHRDAMEFVLTLSKNKYDLTERDIIQIQSIVLANEPSLKGKYRDIQVYIAGTSHTPPSPPEIRELMDNLLMSYHSSKTHPLMNIADFHVRFERIHPFGDGNGRTGRLILNLELIKSGYQPIDVKFKDREDYLDALDDFAITGSTLTFTEMVAQYQLEELTSLRNVLQGRLDTIKYRMENGEAEHVCEDGKKIYHEQLNDLSKQEQTKPRVEPPSR